MHQGANRVPGTDNLPHSPRSAPSDLTKAETTEGRGKAPSN
jgi:hypothetical protein